MSAFAELDVRDQAHLHSIGANTPSAAWPDPDMTVIRPDRPGAPEMSDADLASVFGSWTEWLKSAASVKSTHVDYVALGLLSTASAIIGNTRWAVPWDGWKEPPIVWGMLIGDPSSGKSPALDAVLDPIKEIDAEFTRQHKAEREEWNAKDELARLAHAQWKQDAKAALQDGQTPPEKPEDASAGAPPTRKRARITDATTESVADLLSTTWRGLLLSRDELSGWLGSMDRYSGGGDRPFWLEAFGGRSYTVDRKGKPDPIIVDHLSISVLGGTQPDKLDSMLVHSDDDGLTARFLTVFPDPVPLAKPTQQLDEGFAVDAFKRLHSLQPATDEHGAQRPFYIHFDDDAQNALQTFREQCREWEKDASGLMKSHIGKLPGMSVRVALVLAFLDWATDSNNEHVSCVTQSHIGRACHYVGEHLRGHAHRAYGAASVPAEIKGARKIAEIIAEDRLTQISSREIQRRRLKGLQTSKEITPAIAILIDADWVKLCPSSGSGRPQKIYDVNPKLGGRK